MCSLALLAAGKVCPAQPADTQSASAPGDEIFALARQNLRQALADAPPGPQMLRGLRSTNDKRLVPLLSALCEKGDRSRRLFALMAVSELAGDGANDLCRRRFRQDDDRGIRGIALSHLIDHSAADEQDLLSALDGPEGSLALLAARALVRRGQRDPAIKALTRLVEGTDAEVAALARLTLLGAEDFSQAPRLNALLTSGQTPERLELLLLGLAEKDAIAAAAPVLRRVIDQPVNSRIRAQAFRALGAAAPSEAAEAILQHLAKADDPVDQVQAAEVLIALPKSDEWLAKLAASPASLAAAMAVFEQARRSPQATQPSGEAVESQLRQATLALMATGHPIVADFVLAKAQDQPREAYVAGLLAFVRSVPPDSKEMRPEHEYAARATAVLVKLSSPAAVKGIEEVLAGPFNAVTRAAAAGLIVAEGDALPRLCEPLLKSPYDELVTDAALALGKLGDARAKEALANIVLHADRYPPGLVAIACWDLLKIAGEADAFARELAASIEPRPTTSKGE